jgi:hypothetical protein
MEEEMLRVIEESRKLGKFLGFLNITSIALIPNKNDPRSFEYYRLVSLCNLMYKIITKILTNISKCIFSNFTLKIDFGFFIIDKSMR